MTIRATLAAGLCAIVVHEFGDDRRATVTVDVNGSDVDLCSRHARAAVLSKRLDREAEFNEYLNRYRRKDQS